MKESWRCEGRQTSRFGCKKQAPGGSITTSFDAKLRQWFGPLVAAVSSPLDYINSFKPPKKSLPDPAINTRPGWTDYLDATISFGTAISPQIRAARNLWRPTLVAFSVPRTHFNLLRLLERPVAAETHSAKFEPELKAKPALKQSAQDRPSRNDKGPDSGERPTIPERQPRLHVRMLKSLVGTTLTVGGASGFTLPAGKSITIMFSAQINNSIPAGTCTISNQGRVDYTGGPMNGVLTDAPGGGANEATVTSLLIAPSPITCPSDIITNTDPGLCTATPSFTTPSATGCPTPTVTCLPAGPYPKGTTLVTCTASNGVGSPTSCSFNLTVNDNQAPSIACGSVAAQTANADATCLATVPDVRNLVRAQANDNCEAKASLIVTQSPLQVSSVSGAGSHPITVTV